MLTMKTVIITGSQGLIGKSVTTYLNKNNVKCLCIDYTLGDDLTDLNFVKDYFKSNDADCLINLFALNHHIEKSQKATLFDISLESFRNYMELNLTTLFSVCREYARNRKSGKIINFSSTYGVNSPRKDIYRDEEKHIGYSVSKAGVIMLSKHLATHLAPNFNVNTIVPGGVFNNQNENFIRKYSENTPLGRMMNVEELNGIVEFLISDKSSYITGAEFPVDGGWSAW